MRASGGAQDVLGDRARRVGELFVWHGARDESDRDRLARVERAPGEEQVARARDPDLRREVGGIARVGDPAQQFGARNVARSLTTATSESIAIKRPPP